MDKKRAHSILAVEATQIQDASKHKRMSHNGNIIIPATIQRWRNWVSRRTKRFMEFWASSTSSLLLSRRNNRSSLPESGTLNPWCRSSSFLLDSSFGTDKFFKFTTTVIPRVAPLEGYVETESIFSAAGWITRTRRRWWRRRSRGRTPPVVVYVRGARCLCRRQ